MKNDVTQIIRLPETGGVEVFLAGRAARALGRLDAADPWWKDLRQLDDPSEVPSA